MPLSEPHNSKLHMTRNNHQKEGGLFYLVSEQTSTGAGSRGRTQCGMCGEAGTATKQGMSITMIRHGAMPDNAT